MSTLRIWHQFRTKTTLLIKVSTKYLKSKFDKNSIINNQGNIGGNMKRLTYTKIINSAIEINLNNGYSVIAISLTQYKKEKQIVSFYLKSNSTNAIIPIDELQEVVFEVEITKLYPEILKYTASLLHNETLNSYIEKYSQHVIECFYEFHNTLKVGEK